MCREVSIQGWIKSFMEDDVAHGFFFDFDKISDTASKNLFANKNRLSNVQYDGRKCWWSGEHEGYWLDGIVRHGFLLNNEKLIGQVDEWVNNILSSTDEDYIGIYKNNAINGRYKHSGENGELWTQSRALAVLLVYYEYTSRTLVLEAVIKAVDVTMSKYENINPFESKAQQGGVSHAVGYFEILSWLERLTSKRKYIRYARKLWRYFNSTELRDDDLQIKHLLKINRPFKKHGAHIAEGLWVLPWLNMYSQNERWDRAEKAMLKKLDFHTTPSGAMCCDENVNGNQGTANSSYEFCTTVELVMALTEMMSASADVKIADRIETIVFNAILGARLSDGRGVSYLSIDERKHTDEHRNNGRELFDACHPAAACCVLNEARAMPHYTNGVWMTSSGRDIYLMCFGPVSLKTQIEDTDLEIIQETNYPFSDEMILSVKLSKPVVFKLFIRRPFGVQIVKFNHDWIGTVQEIDDFFLIERVWNNGDVISLKFLFDIKLEANTLMLESGRIVKRGPLIFARPIPHKVDRIHTYGDSNHGRYIHTPDQPFQRFRLESESKMKTNSIHSEYLPDWLSSLTHLQTSLTDEVGQSFEVTLVPMGMVPLRQIVF